MSASSVVLSRLRRLAAADREWIIGNLSADAKARLLELSADQEPAATNTPPKLAPQTARGETSDETALAALEDVDAPSLASVLRSEPAWVVAALVNAREWTWRAEMLRLLPGTVRAEVEHITTAAPAFTPCLVAAIARSFAAALHIREPAPSKFEALVSRLGAMRAKRRLTLHL